MTLYNTKEKLIELLDKVLIKYDRGCLPFVMNEIADHLIANGVTVQKWIPVSERLPEDDIPSAAYLCWWGGHTHICKYWRTRRCFEFNGRSVKVTHWMPLPQPPKGE